MCEAESTDEVDRHRPGEADRAGETDRGGEENCSTEITHALNIRFWAYTTFRIHAKLMKQLAAG